MSKRGRKPVTTNGGGLPVGGESQKYAARLDVGHRALMVTARGASRVDLLLLYKDRNGRAGYNPIFEILVTGDGIRIRGVLSVKN
jgi:hypothetical protein